MIGYLRGRLHSKEPGGIVVEAGGIGYAVEVPLSTYYELGELGIEVELLIHTHVREDAIVLFGFNTAGERSLFRKLNAVSGVGPRLALAILGGMGPAEFLDSVDAGDLGRIVAVPGIGRKTAERLVLEFKDKVTQLRAELGVDPTTAPTGMTSSLQADVVSALENLGYKTALAEKAVRNASAELASDATFESLLKRALVSLT